MEQFANIAQTTLNGAISSGATSLTVNSASGFPSSAQFRIRIDDEIIIVTGVSGTDWIVSRGQESTTAAAHNNCALVTHVLTAGALQNLDAGYITTNKLALARGGTAADLSATGGSGQYVKQTSSGAALTVGPLSSSDLPTTVLSGGGTIGGGTSADSAEHDIDMTGVTALAASGGTAAGTAGAVNLASGTGGAATSSSGGTASSGNVLTLKGGTGGAGASSTNGPGAGGNVSITGGPAGAISGGFSGANGGNVTIDAGTCTGTGTNGTLSLGTTTAESVSIGRSGVTTTIDGVLQVDAHYGAITADTDGSTITFNMATSDKHSVTLGGNRTLAVSNVQVGQVFMIILEQDATGSRTVTWFSGISWPGGTAPTLTTSANKRDVFSFVCVGSGSYLGFVLGQDM